MVDTNRPEAWRIWDTKENVQIGQNYNRHDQAMKAAIILEPYPSLGEVNWRYCVEPVRHAKEHFS